MRSPLLFSFLMVAGCSSSSGVAEPNPALAADGGDAAAAPTGPPGTDAGRDAGPTALDVTCLGDVLPLKLSGGLPFIGVKVDGQPGAFLADLATTTSSLDMSAFAVAPNAMLCDPGKLGAYCNFASFDFFGAWGKISLYTARLFAPDGAVVEAGVLGTDVLSTVALTLDYAGRHAYRAKAGQLCTDAALRAAGYASVTSKGFYANDIKKLVLFSTVAASSTGTNTVPNVPTVPIRVGGASGLAQLDTGFSDKVLPFSINVNEAMLAAIQAKAPTALIRDTGLDQSLTTCAGVPETVDAYRLASSSAVEMVAEDGTPARTWHQAVVFVKHTPEAAKTCGGIGTWSVPAAQMAASFFVDAKTMIFDPFTSRVWLAGP